ncbi:MAG: aromatic ring-hydroxylating dioxygenase subunit alpha [Sinobacteraceae bacterium]|nr:aromatic ring-hydroxylating dioxygenase subunit alpha [Nevskiaceae bacterium]
MPDDEPRPQGSASTLLTGESARAYVAALLDSRRPGYALPGAFFRDERVFAADMELIFARHWLFVASEPEIPEPGDYRTYQIGPYSIFILRQDDGSIAAFHNICRHRGSRILQQPAGVVGARIVCPYHRWSYDSAGQVVDCGPGADVQAAHGLKLRPVHLRNLAGLLFVCLAAEPPADFDDMSAKLLPYLAPHALTRTRIVRQTDLIEEGNWKLTVENNRECFHCGGHPELLNSLFHFLGDVNEASLPAQERSAYERYLQAKELTRQSWERAALPWQRIEHLHGRATAFRTERLVLEGSGESMTLDTQVACRRLLGNLTEARLGTLHLHVQPNAWFHFLSDHIITFMVLPVDRERTLVRTTWLVNAEAEEGRDYDAENLARVWQATNAQDAHFVEETQRGTASPQYVPGPLSSTEFMVDLFHRWYDERMRVGLGL